MIKIWMRVSYPLSQSTQLDGTGMDPAIKTTAEGKILNKILRPNQN